MGFSMSRCRNCNIEVLDETVRCPLCGSVLEYTEEMENMYPNVKIKARKMVLISRIYLFCAILSEAVLWYVNAAVNPEIWWSVIAGLGMLYLYLLLRFAILGQSGYREKTVVLTAIAVLVMVAVDMVTGYRGWSVNYVLPAGIMLMDAGIIVCMVINRRNWQSYLMWQMVMILCSIVPLILAAAGIVTAPFLSNLAFACSLFLFLGSVIIGDRRARVELRRRFHVR